MHFIFSGPGTTFIQVAGLDWADTGRIRRPNFIWEYDDDDVDQDVNREIFASCKICKSSPFFCNVVLGPFERVDIPGLDNLFFFSTFSEIYL